MNPLSLPNYPSIKP